jgi:uncharacterized coiled-coil DUF342 family protein
MGKQELRQEMLNYIDELEEQVDAFKARAHRDDEGDECEDCVENERVRGGLEQNVAKLTQQRDELAGKIRELTEARDTARSDVGKLNKELFSARVELETLKDPSKQVKVTFDQKVELKMGKLGEKLCESYNRHEKSQARWMMVARDAVALLGARLEES